MPNVRTLRIPDASYRAISSHILARIKRMPYGSLVALTLLSASSAAPALSLAEAYSAALANDSQYKAAQAQTEANREALPQALARLRPNVSFSSQRYRIEQERNDGGQRFPKQGYPSYSTSLSIRQPLLNLKLAANLDQAKASLDSDIAVLKLERQALASRLITAYVNLAMGHEQVSLINFQRLSTESRLMAATRALQAGTGIRTDIDEIKAQIDLLQADELQAKQAIRSAQLQLEGITGISISEPIRLRDSKALLEAGQKLGIGTLSDWLDNLNEVSPELVVRKAQVEIAREASRASDADHMPTLELIVQASRNSSENNFFVDSQTKTVAIGVQLALPLYQGGFLQSRDRQTSAALRVAEEQLDLTRKKIRLEVSQAFYSLKEGLVRVSALEKASESAMDVVIANQKSFNAGLRSILDILTAEQRAAEIQLKLRQTQAELLIHYVRLLELNQKAEPMIFKEISSWFD